MQHQARLAALAALFVCLSCSCSSEDERQDGAVALIGARVIDIDSGVASEPSDILIRDGRIVAVAASDPESVPGEYEHFDAGGTFVIPGLWDMHTHIRNDAELETFIPLLVAHGVVGLRDLWGFFPGEFDERLANTPHAPHVNAAARQMMGNNSATPSNARERVRTLAGQGAEFIKVQSDVPAESFYAIIDEARSLGLDVAGHTPIGVSVSDASNAGLVTQEHLLEIIIETSELSDSLRARRIDKLTGGELSMGEYILELGYPELEPMLSTWSEEREQQLFATLVQNNTWQVPTLALFRAWAQMHTPEFWDNESLKYLPSSWRASWTPTTHKWYSSFSSIDPAIVQSRLLAQYENLVRILRRMHAAGVPIMAGTDASEWNFIVPGQSLHDELGIYVEAGMTPLEALRTATVAPIEFLGLQDQAGSVAVGKRADLVLLGQDPVTDISHLGSIHAVLIGGQVFDRDYLDALLQALEQR